MIIPCGRYRAKINTVMLIELLKKRQQETNKHSTHANKWKNIMSKHIKAPAKAIHCLNDRSIDVAIATNSTSQVKVNGQSLYAAVSTQLPLQASGTS